MVKPGTLGGIEAIITASGERNSLGRTPFTGTNGFRNSLEVEKIKFLPNNSVYVVLYFKTQF